MIRPSIELAVAFNRAVRYDDEWFDEPDDLERLQRALGSIAEFDDVVQAAAVLLCRSRVPRPSAKGTSAQRSCSAGGFWTGTASLALD